MATALEVVRGISQVMANSYDGARDKDCEPIKTGLKREEKEWHLRDRRVIDGFKLKLQGNHLILNYHSECLTSEHHDKKFEENMEKTLEEYRTKLNKTMPEGPYRFEESELSENLSQPYIRAVMSSNYGRSKMPQSLVKAFDGIKENAKFTDKMYEETGEPKTFKDFLK